jgi:hypothetical protein
MPFPKIGGIGKRKEGYFLEGIFYGEWLVDKIGQKTCKIRKLKIVNEELLCRIGNAKW